MVTETHDRRAHLRDPALYAAFYDAATAQSPICVMHPQEPRLLWALAHITTNADVIDIGAHKLDMTVYLRQATHGRVVAVDIAAAALAQGRTRPDAAGIDTWAGDACALPYPDDSFDVAVLCEILEHVPDDAALLREAERVVRPGGYVVISVPANAEGWDTDGDRATKEKMGYHLDAHVREFLPHVVLRGKYELRTRYVRHKVKLNGDELGFRLASYVVTS